MSSVGCSVNGSTTAVSGSGIRSMSDSWISWNPRIDEPSKPSPSSNTSALRLMRGDREVLHETREVAEADIDHLDARVLDQLQNIASGALLHPAVPPRGAGRSVAGRALIMPRSFATRPGRCTPCR